MLQDLAVRVVREGLILVLVLSAGPMLISLVVGLAISLFQATTQIQEQTLTFVPKILAVFLSLILLGPWSIGQMVKFTAAVFNLIPNLFR